LPYLSIYFSCSNQYHLFCVSYMCTVHIYYSAHPCIDPKWLLNIRFWLTKTNLFERRPQLKLNRCTACRYQCRSHTIPVLLCPANMQKILHYYITQNYIFTVLQGVPLTTKPGWLADRCPMSQQLGTLQTYSFSFLTQRTYSCSYFFAISSLVLELLKKSRVR